MTYYPRPIAVQAVYTRHPPLPWSYFVNSCQLAAVKKERSPEAWRENALITRNKKLRAIFLERKEIVRQLILAGHTSQYELIERTGLQKNMIVRCANELIDEGIIIKIWVSRKCGFTYLPKSAISCKIALVTSEQAHKGKGDTAKLTKGVHHEVRNSSQR